MVSYFSAKTNTNITRTNKIIVKTTIINKTCDARKQSYFPPLAAAVCSCHLLWYYCLCFFHHDVDVLIVTVVMVMAMIILLLKKISWLDTIVIIVFCCWYEYDDIQCCLNIWYFEVSSSYLVMRLPISGMGWWLLWWLCWMKMRLHLSASLGLFGFQTILEIRRKAILCGRHSCE